MSDQDQWDCEAYGPEGRTVGALCFVSPDGRTCASPADCHATMDAERHHVHSRIREAAEQGDETARYLAAEFTSPEQLLGGGR